MGLARSLDVARTFKASLVSTRRLACTRVLLNVVNQVHADLHVCPGFNTLVCTTSANLDKLTIQKSALSADINSS